MRLSYTCLLTLSLLVAGCGQKGPLYLPQEKTADGRETVEHRQDHAPH